MMATGRYCSIKQLEAAEKINSYCVSRLLRHGLLGSCVVEAILDRRQAAGMTLSELMQPFPVEWEQQ